MHNKYTLTTYETFQRWFLSFAGAIIPPMLIVYLDTNEKSNYSLVITFSIFVGFLFTQLTLRLSINDVVKSINNDSLEKEQKKTEEYKTKEADLNKAITKLNEELEVEKSEKQKLMHDLECAKDYCDIKNIKTECLTIITSVQSLLEGNYTTKQIKGFMLHLSKKVNESDFFNSKIEHYLSFVTVYGKSNSNSHFESNTVYLLDEYLENINEGKPNNYKEKRFKL